MAFTRFSFTLHLIIISFIGYSCQQLYTAHPVPNYVTCPSYCNAKGDWQSALACFDYCCGNSTYRYCCSEVNLDISNKYDEVSSCSCPNSDCYSTPIWEYVLYFFAPLAFFAIIAICCCQCDCRSVCKRCKRTADNATTGNRIAAASPTSSITTHSDAMGRDGSLHLDHDFSYGVQPPSYETVTGDLPKYEDIVDEAGCYYGPYDNVESTEDIFAPPVEYETIAAAAPSEWQSNDTPPSYTPAETHEVA